MMLKADLMQRYTAQERQADQPGMVADHDQEVWRFVVPEDGFTAILDQKPSRDFGPLVRHQKQRVQALGCSLEWKWFAADDGAEALSNSLTNAGFEVGEDEAMMAFNLADADVWLQQPTSVSITCRKVGSVSDLTKVFAVQAAVWHADMSDRLAVALTLCRNTPELMSYYLVEIDGVAVASGWASYTENSEFVGLWGGSCLAQYRGLGCYKALILARAKEAYDRGRSFLTIDAMESSRPIVEKMGFELVTITRPYTI